MGPKLPTDYPWKPPTRGANIAFGVAFAVTVALVAVCVLALTGALWL